MRAIVSLFIVVVLAVGVVWIWPRLESDPPVLAGPERIELGAGERQIDVAWEDPGMGLAEVTAVLRLPGTPGDDAPREIVLHEKRLRSNRPGDPIGRDTEERQTLVLDAARLELPDGESTLVLRARDASWSGFGEGNAAEVEIPVVVDTKPPRVSIESGITYVRRGGAALLAYRVDADAERSGVRVGDAFFPGWRDPSGRFVAIFGIPVEAAEQPRVEVVGIDAFGNETALPFDARIRERTPPEISIALSDGFLDRVDRTFRSGDDAAGATALAVFQRVNTDLRARNDALIAETIPEPTEAAWSGAFEQMRGSKVTSQFAELRHYTQRGRRVSRARHYGYDLASTSRAPITASNAGTVLFAGDNGIYGNLVLIDHGLGITTLYGHLSSLEVGVGDRVTKGQVLGRSGATGLAGGDHLHFAVLVGQTYVDPLEWWDPKWIRDHITSRLDAGGADPDA